MEQAAEPREHLLFGLCATLAGEGVMAIARETAREVLTDIAVSHFLRAIHQNLSSIIELGDAIDGKQQRQCLLQHQRVAPIAQEAIGIVIVDKGHHVRGIRIEVVVDKGVIEAVQSFPPVVGLLTLGLTKLVEEGEIHDGLQI